MDLSNRILRPAKMYYSLQDSSARFREYLSIVPTIWRINNYVTRNGHWPKVGLPDPGTPDHVTTSTAAVTFDASLLVRARAFAQSTV